jgi:hypothetical protein
VLALFAATDVTALKEMLTRLIQQPAGRAPRSD